MRHKSHRPTDHSEPLCLPVPSTKGTFCQPSLPDPPWYCAPPDLGFRWVRAPAAPSALLPSRVHLHTHCWGPQVGVSGDTSLRDAGAQEWEAVWGWGRHELLLIHAGEQRGGRWRPECWSRQQSPGQGGGGVGCSETCVLPLASLQDIRGETQVGPVLFHSQRRQYSSQVERACMLSRAWLSATLPTRSIHELKISNLKNKMNSACLKKRPIWN